MSPWVLPGYAEERQLGRGASGRVVEAVHEASGQRVAIKYLAPKLFRDPDFLAGFRAEADLLRSLDVPQVVRLFDYVEEPAHGAAIVMELVNGVSLHEMITRRGATSPESALVVLKGSLLGLAAAHSLGIVHRDYKPENVLVDGEGYSKLSDFGVAVKEGRRVPAAGTPLYMAPEQWEGAPATPSSDIYAAAAVFFECLTSKTPFSGRLGQLHHQHMTADIPMDQVEQPLRGLIARGMAKDPADRPRSAMSFLSELEAVALAAYGTEWEERGRSQLRERAAALLLLLLGAGIGAGTGGMLAATFLANHRNAVISGAAVAVAIIVGGSVTAVALSGGGGTPSKPTAATSTPAVAGSGSGSGGSTPATPATPATATFTAVVTVTPPVATNSCATPTTFTFKGNLTASAPGTLTYRWVYSTGKSGPVQTMTFASAGTRPVSGGSVQATTATNGWAAIQSGNPSSVISNKATYRLVCSTTPSAVTAAAAVTPATAMVACGAAPPSFTFTGTITASKATTVTYHWAQTNGTTSAPATLSFGGPGTRAVAPLTVTPATDTASGGAEIVVTSPNVVGSNTPSYALTCTTAATPVTLTAAAHVTPATKKVGCNDTPPAFTFSGSVTASKAATVHYHWKLPGGNGPDETLTFTGASTRAVTSPTVAAASDATSGSGSIVITSPVTVTSAAATFSVTCTQVKVAVTLSSSPSLPEAVACGVTPPTIKFSGLIEANQNVSGVKYHWVRPNGTATGTATLALTANQGKTVTDTFQPGSDTFSGTETLDITAPVQVSRSIPVVVTCSFPTLQITTGSIGPCNYFGNNPGCPATPLTATGGDGKYSWSATGLPPDVTLSAGGVLDGSKITRADLGSWNVTVTVTDGESPAHKAVQTYTLTVNDQS